MHVMMGKNPVGIKTGIKKHLKKKAVESNKDSPRE